MIPEWAGKTLTAGTSLPRGLRPGTAAGSRKAVAEGGQEGGCAAEKRGERVENAEGALRFAERRTPNAERRTLNAGRGAGGWIERMLGHVPLHTRFAVFTV